MDVKKTIEEMVRDIIQSIRAEEISKPKVLFIFCDSQAHEPYLDQLIKIQNNGISHDVLFLDGETSAWLGIQRIECAGAGKIIATDEYAPAPLELPKEYEGIIIPEIDLDNTARVVTGSKGTIKAEIIFSALVLQKFVLIGEAGPGIKRSDRRSLRTIELPAPYQRLFRRHIQEMKELGIEFKPLQNLADAVIQKINIKKQVKSLSSSDHI